MTSLIVGALLLAVGLALGALLGYALAGRRHGGVGGLGGGSVDPVGAVTAVLSPAADALGRVQEQLQRIEAERAGSYAGLREQVAHLQHSSRELGAQTRSLVGALRSPAVRGRWGEVQLQRIVELAGMVEHCDFSTQVHRPAGVRDRDDAAAARPDMVIRLSGGRQIPLDAKAPLDAWLQLLELPPPTAGGFAAADGAAEAARADLLRRHAKALRHQVDVLAGKQYWQLFQPAPEFVVMFVPGEPLLDAAMQVDPQLTEYAFERNVVIATPSTLIALLRTIAFSWRSERLSASAERIHALGRELHGRLAVLTEHFGKLGSSLQRSVESYNAALRSYESRVLVSARRFTEFGTADRPLVTPDALSQVPLQPRDFERLGPSSVDRGDDDQVRDADPAGPTDPEFDRDVDVGYPADGGRWRTDRAG
ncbi:DNA recombination protein RmuC [Nakamurella aerolata]|uniref:DNA recombination protein RmuC n=1 Tax=Nakamurella aerolata TaxID=1656892 RepID=A0A849A888_9ACTN|nr:DNA recombination protein RmuC [Nakamurella aerolata]NNG35291.1 DNA recombination protein RmuC [Nakamurella aerolata]